jgi:hypothetical protein
MKWYLLRILPAEMTVAVQTFVGNAMNGCKAEGHHKRLGQREVDEDVDDEDEETEQEDHDQEHDQEHGSEKKEEEEEEDR